VELRRPAGRIVRGAEGRHHLRPPLRATCCSAAGTNYCRRGEALTKESQLHLGRLERRSSPPRSPCRRWRSGPDRVGRVAAAIGIRPAGEPPTRRPFDVQRQWRTRATQRSAPGWRIGYRAVPHATSHSHPAPTPRPFVHTMTRRSGHRPHRYTVRHRSSLSSLRALITSTRTTTGRPGDTCQFRPTCSSDLGLGIPDVNQFLKSATWQRGACASDPLPAAEPGEADRRCVATTGFVNAAQELAIDLLDVNLATGGSSCSGLFTTFADLQGAEVRSGGARGASSQHGGSYKVFRSGTVDPSAASAGHDRHRRRVTALPPSTPPTMPGTATCSATCGCTDQPGRGRAT
jgi:hypothetical protein